MFQHSFVAVAVALLEVLSSVAPSVSTPLPLPLPLMMADYSPSLVSANRSIPYALPRGFDPFSSAPANHATHRRDASSVGELADMYDYLDAATLNANNFRELASRSAAVDEDDFDFQRDCVSELTGFTTNMQGIQAAVAETGVKSDKGLANYDKTNQLETVLKDTVNLNKNVLSSTDVLVYNIPALGPTLGPIVYDIKCLVDQLLNQVEDLSDDLINQIQPLLRPLSSSKAPSAACKSGVVILGLCI